jgi:hypothetical protein
VSPLVFRGRLDARVVRGAVLDGAVSLGGATLALPVAWGTDGSSPAPGAFSAERVSGYGLAIERVTSAPRLRAGALVFPDLRYVHAGGAGQGWMELAVDDRPIRLRAHLEAEHVDLARASREAGATMARVTGNVRYSAAAQYTVAGGLDAAAHVESEKGGGDVAIDAIQSLLQSATVQVETTGILRQTLENLRAFQYESLEGDLTLRRGRGYVDLSLRGRKRFGIFPGPVEAINLRNVPLSILARTLAKGTTP